MTQPQEVSISIDNSFTDIVCAFAVGFLKFRVEGKEEFAEPRGTGTFVKLGKVHGILTAGHVVKEFGEHETVGLVRFPSIQPALQNYRLNLDYTKRIVEWNGQDGDAPDIAFVSIPHIEAKKLEDSGAVFYNLGIPREFKVLVHGHRGVTCNAVVGVVGEWTEEGASHYLSGKRIEIGGLFGAAKQIQIIEEKGTDLIELEVDYESGPRIPKSYGGVSGGALWQLHVELDQEGKTTKVDKRLYGVAFRQSADNKRITCNASASIEAMVKKIAEEWPQDSAS